MNFNTILENAYKSDDGQYFFNRTKQSKTDEKQHTERNKELHSEYLKHNEELKKAKQSLIYAFKAFGKNPIAEREDQFGALVNDMERAIKRYRKALLQIEKVYMHMNSNEKQYYKDFDDKSNEEKKNAKVAGYAKTKLGEAPYWMTGVDSNDLEKAKRDTEKRAAKRVEEKEKQKNKKGFRKFFGY